MRRGPYRPRELRIRLFNEVVRLRGRGYSYKKIIDIIKERYGVNFHEGQVSEWVRGVHNPYNGVYLPTLDSLEPSKELAYVIGAVAGDGTAVLMGRYDARIRLKVRDSEFAEEFARCLGRVLGKDPPRVQRLHNGMYFVGQGCKVLCQLLKKPIDIPKIRRFIEYNDECKAAFLRGFFDGEGSAHKNGDLTLSNTCVELLEYVKRLLETLGIEATGPHLYCRSRTTFHDRRQNKTYTRRKDVYNIYIPADSRLKFYRRVGFTIWRKQERLEKYLEKTGRLSPKPLPPPLSHLSYP